MTKKVELVRTRTQKERVRTTVLQHWAGHQKDERREGDKRPLGEGMLRGRETRRGGRVGM